MGDSFHEGYGYCYFETPMGEEFYEIAEKFSLDISLSAKTAMGEIKCSCLYYSS